MKRGALNFDSKQFAGHETFPLRLLWLKKAFDEIGAGAPARMFQDPDAITRFGVGRNMAVSIRYWAYATEFFEEQGALIVPTELGRAILSDRGLDPYLEQASTIWLAHWHIASTARFTTTAYYAFNGLGAAEFDPSTLIEELFTLASSRQWRATRGTLKRDVEVFMRGYVRRSEALNEDAAEPLLSELGLVREARIGGWYEFVRGPKPNLHDGIFAYGLLAFWKQHGGPTTLTAEQICYAPGSPGRVFKLDENSVITRLMRIDSVTDGAFSWIDNAGLRQVQHSGHIATSDLVAMAYPKRRILSVAA